MSISYWIKSTWIYANIIHLADKGIGVFFEELDKRGLKENSIVIITSGHAMPMGEHNIFHQEYLLHIENGRNLFHLLREHDNQATFLYIDLQAYSWL